MMDSATLETVASVARSHEARVQEMASEICEPTLPVAPARVWLRVMFEDGISHEVSPAHESSLYYGNS